MSQDVVPNMNRLVRSRILRTLHRLDRLARGEERGFRSDHQLRACIALVRLARQMLGRLAEDDQGESHPPEWDEPERDLAFRRMMYMDSMTPEQRAEFSARRKAAIEKWETSLPPPFKSPEDAMQYHRTHGVQHISEVEEECWPPHLRESSLKKEESDE